MPSGGHWGSNLCKFVFFDLGGITLEDLDAIKKQGKPGSLVLARIDSGCVLLSYKEFIKVDLDKDIVGLKIESNDQKA